VIRQGLTHSLHDQEFWLGNPELSELYTSHLHQAGYDTFKLARTNNRGDGERCPANVPLVMLGTALATWYVPCKAAMAAEDIIAFLVS
jgi:hypothetical protein